MMGHMNTSGLNCGPGLEKNPSFTTTHWSVVKLAGDGQSPGAEAALERLCRNYWYPLYVFVRRRGHSPHDAQDLTQEFFSRLLAKEYLRAVDPAKGKFRSFLLAALEHFLANDWRRSRTQKRGGNFTLVSLEDAEQHYHQVPAAGVSAEKLFEQQWATALLDQVLQRLREEFVAAGKEKVFDELKVYLSGEKQAMTYSMLAEKLGTTEAALKMSVCRMKQRYGELLHSEIANTVSSPEQVEAELRELLAALSG